MESIYNLIIFVVVIGLLIFILNNLSSHEKKEKIKIRENIQDEEDGIFPNIPKGYPLSKFDYAFDYEAVSEEEKEFNLQDKFSKELDYGANMNPRYEPTKGFEKKEFYTHELKDQKVIYDNRMYEKPIHKYRNLNVTDDNLPKKINQLFNQSITDFKSLVPLKKGLNGDFIIEGGSNESAYTPDFVNYDNEKPENGGLIPKLYGSVYGNDPMLNSSPAVF